MDFPYLTLKNAERWMDRGSSYFPNVTYEKIKTYLEGEDAAKIFRDGKRLFDSGHIK